MRRRCSDPACVVFFLSFLAGLGYVFTVARRTGDLAKLTHGIDWRGRVCGVSPGVEHTPLLLWCAPGSEQQLRLQDGVCTDRCPTGSGSVWCPGEARPFAYRHEVLGTGGTKQVVVGGSSLLVRNLTLRRDYASHEALGYCFPRGNALLQGAVARARLDGRIKQAFLAARGAAQSWRFLLGVAAGSVVLGYAFLLLLWACFDKLLYVLAFVLHACLLVGAFGFGYVGFHDEYNVFGHYFDMSTARLCTFACSFLVIIFWALFLLLSLYSKEAIRSTVASVRETCEVVAQVPSLLLQPLAHSAVTLSALALLLFGFCMVLSTGKVIPQDSPVQQSGIKIEGIHRTLEFSAIQWVYVLSWAFGIVWAMEVLSALGQFAISHAVVNSREPDMQQCFPVLRGYAMGLTLRLGSLAFGGFVLGCLKLLAAVFTFLARQARDEAGVRGAISRALCCCCAQCALWVEGVLSMVNDLVYTDVALQGSQYMEAAENVVRVAASNPAAYGLLKGSATAVRVSGTLAITGTSTFLAYECLTSTWLHELLQRRVSDGAAAALGTASVPGTTVAAALVSFHVAMAFMTVFYQTTHTLTYCKLIGAVTVGDSSPTSARKAVPLSSWAA